MEHSTRSLWYIGPLTVFVAAILALAACDIGVQDSPPPSTATSAPTQSAEASGTSPAATTITSTVVTTTEVASTTTLPTTVPTTSVATSTTAGATTTTTLLVEPSTYAVVLVSADDVLNVRQGPGVSFPIVYSLPPDETGVASTGSGAVVGSSLWLEIDSDNRRGWVNSFFLTEEVAGSEFVASRGELLVILDGVVDVTAANGDLTSLMSHRGLHVIHFDPLRRFRVSELAGLLTDPTVYWWGNGACSEEECPEVGRTTFKVAVADSLVSAYDDPDRQLTFDEISGFSGYVPLEFANFHYVAIHDPGDNPEYEGCDWVTWVVFFERQPGGWQIAGLSIDHHVP